MEDPWQSCPDSHPLHISFLSLLWSIQICNEAHHPSHLVTLYSARIQSLLVFYDSKFRLSDAKALSPLQMSANELGARIRGSQHCCFQWPALSRAAVLLRCWNSCHSGRLACCSVQHALCFCLIKAASGGSTSGLLLPSAPIIGK